MTLSASDLATKLHVPLERAQTVLKQIHANFAPSTSVVELNGSDEKQGPLDILGQTFTCGDDALDGLLGGGITIGQIFEVTGEA